MINWPSSSSLHVKLDLSVWSSLLEQDQKSIDLALETKKETKETKEKKKREKKIKRKEKNQ